MSYRTPDNSNTTTQLYAAELEVLHLREENERLRAMLKTEIVRPPFKPKAELPELLNASLLYEPNALYRTYRAFRCFQGNHRWVSMIDIDIAKLVWKKWNQKPKDRNSYHWTDNPIYFLCKIQCRDCKLVGKECMVNDPDGEYNRLGGSAHDKVYSIGRSLVSSVENYFCEIDP